MHKRITESLGIENTGKYGFVNNYPSQDVELYLDYNLINIAQTVGIKHFDAKIAHRKILDFFKTSFSNYREDDNNLNYLIIHELNDTHFGMSLVGSNSRGKGPSEESLVALIKRVTKKKLDLKTFNDPNHFRILTPRIGPDYFSDLITNIVFKELYDFTKSIIESLHVNDKMGKSHKKEYKYWDLDTHEWKSEYLDAFVIDNFDTILVPTQIVSKKPGYDVNYFLNNIIFKIQREKELSDEKITNKKARTKKEIRQAELSKYSTNKSKNLVLDKIANDLKLLDNYDDKLSNEHYSKNVHKMKDDNDFKI